LTGPSAKASESIRDGLLAAYYQAINQQKTSDTLSFYDTTPYPDIAPLLAITATPETRLMIGPLLKEHVSQLLSTPPEMPVLVLNRVNSATSNNIWQFALAPEEEIGPLVQLMKQQGIKKVRILMQNDANSERLRQGFEQVWLAEGGELVPTYMLSSTANDGLTSSIKQLLAEPQTAQAFYLASPQLSLYALPLLNFYQRSPVPVFSASQSYDAEKSLLERQDLNGLYFCGLPWIISPEQWALNQTIRDSSSPESSSYDRLFAFGADAWTISQQINLSKKTPINGRTGALSLVDGQVHRLPLCAEVINGKATPTKTTTRASR
jgi:outer membrane PBP1 activator LpoA protein